MTLNSDSENTYPLTDAGNAEALKDEWGVMFKYVYEWKSWIVYGKGRWEPDNTGLMKIFAIKTMRKLAEESLNIPDLDERKKAIVWYITGESEKKISSMINLVSAQFGVSITADKLDQKPWLLNLKNGTYDLYDNVLLSADPRDYLTQQIDIDYKEDAKSEEWEGFLNTIFNNNQDLIDFIQRSIGYTINGTQLERVFYFLYGLGKNGKSALMDALRRVLGPYATEAKPELMMEKRYSSEGPNEGQASLKGIRLLTATEIKRNQTLDVSLIKRMTGGEPIWHERKFQRGFSFNPSHTLWLSGNHEPQIKDTTNSIWDRIKKLPFDVRISDAQEIKGYGEKLAKEHGEAILAWCIAGARKYRESGLSNPPDCVLTANEEYRARQDTLHDFIDMKIISEPSFNTTVQEMYKAYEIFCKDDDIDPLGKKSFNDAMRERGFKDKRGHGNKPVWVGVTFQTEKVTNLALGVTNETQFQESFLACAGGEKLSQKQVTKVTKVTSEANFQTKSNHVDSKAFLDDRVTNGEIFDFPEE